MFFVLAWIFACEPKNVQTDIFSLINFKDAKEAKVLKEVQDEMASNFWY
ncbi:hypothetical protein VB002_05170 [Campylobacter concisus]